MEIETHPVQRSNALPRDAAVAPKAVTMKAYEVYCHLYGPQDALVTGHCRGGFHTHELIAFLYAGCFPKSEWRARAEEASLGMKNL